jgi:sec-independent protein translocase protein TatB
MFDLSWGKVLLIGMVALIAIGPKDLPGVLRTVGQWMTKIRRMAAEFQGQFQEAMREAEMADLKKQVEGLADPVKSFTDFNPLETTRKELETAFDDKVNVPASGAATTEPSAAGVSTTEALAATSTETIAAAPTEPVASADAPPAVPAEAVTAAPLDDAAKPQIAAATTQQANPEALPHALPETAGRAS